MNTGDAVGLRLHSALRIRRPVSGRSLERMKKNTYSLPPGTRLEEYTIERTLSGGGFSLVYLAHAESQEQKAAIKEYFPGKLATRDSDLSVHARDRDSEERFQRGRSLFFQEAGTLAALQHPNIVPVWTFFQENGTAYLVMEYEPGQNLQCYIRKYRGKLSERFLLTVFPPLLNALDFIHQQGYLHLDIKPGNIHLRQGGNPVLLDFGAVHRRPVSRLLQRAHVVSAGFASPEQFERTGYVGPWTDLYAIGATMRACLDGQPPLDVRKRKKQDALRPASLVHRRQYSASLLKAIDWAMDMDPLLRPQSCGALLETLPELEPESTPERAAGFFNRFVGGLNRPGS